jgi:transposase-like protein
MAWRQVDHDAAQIDRARELYTRSRLTMKDIARLLGMSPQTLRLRIEAWGWGPRPRHRDGGAEDICPAPVQAAAMPGRPVAERIRIAVEREIDAVERALDRLRPDRDVGDSERTARVLGGLVKVLKESRQLGADEPDGEGAVDYDELRRELARRLQGVLDARPAG